MPQILRLNFCAGNIKMWFKQASIWRLPDVSKLTDIKLLNQYLSKVRFTPVTDMAWDSIGFIPFTSTSAPNDTYALKIQDTIRINLKKEEKVLTSSMIRGVLDERVALIEQQESRKVGRKEKAEIKEAIIDELLPRALTKISTIEAIIDLKNSLLIVNSAVPTTAELMLTHLRQALCVLKATPPNTQVGLSKLMTEWLLDGKAPDYFELDADCELKGLGDSAPTIRASNQILTDDGIINHARDGKVVTQLGLCWHNRVRFIFTQNFTLKRIQFLDVIQEEIAQEANDYEHARNASQLLMADTLSNVIHELADLAGGWLSCEEN
ncbi:recombination-associated protein RdgC [Snodgrassella alvi]|jgi:recombination associated protein RdgC|nr:recombination-associated protein RdgC [Snodgrassella alvi]